MIFKCLCPNCRAEFFGDVPTCVWCGTNTIKKKLNRLDPIKTINRKKFNKYAKKLREEGIQ